MKAAGITTWFQFTQGQCLFCHQGKKTMAKYAQTIFPFWPLFCRCFGYHFVSVWKIDSSSHANVALYFAQILKIFVRIMASFSALGMRRHPLHPHAIRLCLPLFRRPWARTSAWKPNTRVNDMFRYDLWLKLLLKRVLIQMVLQLGNGFIWIKLFNAITVKRKTLWSLLSIQKTYVPTGMV